jgi:hypothetical protein
MREISKMRRKINTKTKICKIGASKKRKGRR